MRVSIVVRAYNEEEHFERLLLGLRAQRRKADEIVPVSYTHLTLPTTPYV